MQGVTNYSMDLVGVKRQIPVTLEIPRFGEIIKKVKQDSPQKFEMRQLPQETLMPQIPPLVLSKTKDMNTEYLQSLLLLNQSVVTQRYLQLLTLNQCVQQQHHQQQQQHQHQHQQQQQLEFHRSLLAMKRENSASSCHSMSTCHSSPGKIPILIRGPSAPEAIPRLDACSPQKKSKVSACKNYIALLCTGFARSILTANSGSDILAYLHEIMNIKKSKYSSLLERQDLQDYILEHLYKDICGKRVKKMNKGRDFKVRNSEELEMLLTAKEEDSDLVKFRKEVMKEMIDYFFVSKYYYEWLEKGMINQANRDFFLKNKAEIQRKFSNPTLYKPHFDYNS